MSHTKKTTRGIVVAVAGFGLAAGMLPSLSASASPDSSENGEPTISSEVQAQLDKDGKADVWLTLADQADLSSASEMTWEERGHFVYDTLTAHADTSQADLRAELDAAGADYQTFWINNSIFVKGASAELVSEVTSDSTLSAVTPDRVPELIDTETSADKATNETAPLATEWGLDSIGAPEVWETYGTTGEGIVVGTFDTGADTTHPALNAAYRGTATGSDDYNWYDSTGASPTPVDHGVSIGVPHGTHVTGTMVGEDGENQIGVAPGAQFIVAAGCCVDGAQVFEAFEWFVAPTPVGSDAGDPDQRPHIVNNSWGFTGQQVPDPTLEAALEAWDAAGIFGTFSSGNSGPGGNPPGPDCDNISSPAWNNGAHYVVANHQQDGTIAPSSSRGPGEDDEQGVDIAAPGSNIRSSVPGGGYENWDGTSMAAPHVSGAVALLWSHYPDLVGDQAATIAALDATATDKEDPTCGGDAANNETWGEGQIDLVAAFESLEEEEPEPPVETPEIERVAGADRYETAEALLVKYPEGVETVFIASGTEYPDAMTGAPAAAQGKFEGIRVMEDGNGNPAPVLLSQPANLTNPTRSAIDALQPANIMILGGTSIIGASVEDELREGGANVTRIAGDDRYETAANLATTLFTDPQVVYIATGDEDAYADALAGSAVAGADDAPVLLTKPDHVPDATKAALDTLGAENIVVIGGEKAVDAATYDDLGATERIAGDHRWETTALLSEQNYGENVSVVYLASGWVYPDALASAALAGSEDVPVLLTKTNLIPNDIKVELQRLSPERVVIVGGTQAVSQSVEEYLNDAENWK